MDAGVVHQYLDGADFKYLCERRATRLRIGDIEGHGFGRATGRADFAGHDLGLRAVAVGVHNHMQAIARQASTNGRTDAATAAGDERAHHAKAPVESSFAAKRPLNTAWLPARISNS